MTRLKNLIFYIVTNAVLTFALFAAAELVCRAWLQFRPSSQATLSQQSGSAAFDGVAWKDLFFSELTRYQHGLMSSKPYEPYSLWREEPFAGSLITVLPSGYRMTVNAPSSPHTSPLLVFFFGGSTAFSLQVPNELTIPSQLSKLLAAAYPNRAVEVRNFGVDGFAFPQEVVLLEKLLVQGERPDLVIFYDGVNDTFNYLVSDTPHAFYDRFRGALNRGIAVRELFTSMVRKLAVVGLLAPSFTTPRSISLEQAGENARKLTNDVRNRLVLVNSALASAYHFRVLNVWQSNIFATQKKLSAEEHAIIRAAPENLSSGFEVAERKVRPELIETNPEILDCKNCFDAIESSVFLDFCHVNHLANQAVAQRILHAIVERRLIDRAP